MKTKKLLSPEHWEKKYSVNPQESNSPADAFNPKCGKYRPSTHTKVNETDY